MKKIGILFVVLTLAFSVSAFAGSINENAKSTDYVTKAPAMLLRGAGNLLLSPAEILVHGYQGTMEGKPFIGTIEGLANGLYWCLDRAGRGAWDVVTFWAPRYNGAPPTHTFEFLSA